MDVTEAASAHVKSSNTPKGLKFEVTEDKQEYKILSVDGTMALTYGNGNRKFTCGTVENAIRVKLQDRDLL